MADAATCLIDREILRIAATTASEHPQLGVVDPTSAKLTSEAGSVGTRVIMSDNNNAVLTDVTFTAENGQLKASVSNVQVAGEPVSQETITQINERVSDIWPAAPPTMTSRKSPR